MKDRALEAERLRALGAAENARLLVMTDGGEELGAAVARVEGGTLLIDRLMTSSGVDLGKDAPDPEASFILDTLMRSAASFGEANGADRIEVPFPDRFGFFAARGFETGEDGAKAPMSLIVHYI